MSHFTVLVIGENHDEQLAPFDENLQVERVEDGEDSFWTNPRAKWDWYSIGGRWTGFLKLKQGGRGEVGKPGIMTNPAQKGYADQARLRDIDIEGMRDEAGARAAALYDKFLEFTDGKGLPPMELSWEELCKDESLTIDERRDRYHSQPAMDGLRKLKERVKPLLEADRENDALSALYWCLYWCDDPGYFNTSREAFIQSARNRAFTTFAVLKDGEWFERGEMGWWGMVSNEKDRERWDEEFAKLLDGLDPDTMLTVVDCHI